MAKSKNNQNVLVSKFETVIETSNIDLTQEFKIREPELYQNMVGEVLTSNGFPESANAKNVSHDFSVRNKTQYDVWAEDFIESESNDDRDLEEIPLKEIIDFILDRMENLDIVITIKDNLSEWIEKNPTIDYMVSKIEKNFVASEMAKFIREDRYGLLDKVREACENEGMTINNLDDVKYEITNVKITTPLDALGTIMSYEVKERNTTATSFIDKELYETLITEVDYDVKILTEPSELE